jgi:prepilin-type N-terminal cleavage/methylation domain-containing protein
LLKQTCTSSAAFTLVELLAVISIMALLSVVTIPALRSSEAAQISTSSAQISNLMDASREAAIVSGQPVAVAMLSADSNSVQRFTALQYVPATTSWKRISKWESLPTGILAYSGTDSSGNPVNAFQPQNSPSVGSAMPGLVYSGKTYQPKDGYGYVIFLPDGSLYQNPNDKGGTFSIPCILRVVQGTSSATGITYKGPKDGNGNPVNYVDLVLNEATGQTKIVRP